MEKQLEGWWGGKKCFLQNSRSWEFMLLLDGCFLFFNAYICLFIFGNQNQKTGNLTRVVELRGRECGLSSIHRQSPRNSSYLNSLSKKQKKNQNGPRRRETLARRPSCRGVALARQRETATLTRSQIGILALSCWSAKWRRWKSWRRICCLASDCRCSALSLCLILMVWWWTGCFKIEIYIFTVKQWRILNMEYLHLKTVVCCFKSEYLLAKLTSTSYPTRQINTLCADIDVSILDANLLFWNL